MLLLPFPGIAAAFSRHIGISLSRMPAMAFAPFAALLRWISPPQPETRAALVQGGAAVPDPTVPLFKGEPIPRYPNRGVAAPAASPELLMESQAELINQLHQTSSFSYTEFNTLIRPAIRNYAAYAHLLPASETHHHCGHGGLFRHGLEVACNAAIACEAKVFVTDRWASERHQLTPRWHLCAILGGMVHDMGKPLIDVGAVDASGNLLWNPHTSSLWDWLQENVLDHYYIHWRPGARFKRHEAFNTLALYRILPARTLAWLGEHGGKEPETSRTRGHATARAVTVRPQVAAHNETQRCFVIRPISAATDSLLVPSATPQRTNRLPMNPVNARQRVPRNAPITLIAMRVHPTNGVFSCCCA